MSLFRRCEDANSVTAGPSKRRRAIKSEDRSSVGLDSGYASSPAPSSSMAVVRIADDSDAEIELCDEQKVLVNLIVEGKNVFYTGSAGCGKSTVLRAIVARLRNLGRRVSVTAPTGRAALDINGCTTWTFAGWTPDSMKKALEDLEKRAATNRVVKKRLRELDVLVIDEISMVEQHFFERLNAILKAARGSSRAFGGAQLVVAGDFCQLPPVKPFRCCKACGSEMRVVEENTIYECSTHGRFYDTDKWAFAGPAWEEAHFWNFYLTIVHRQTDLNLVAILEKLRMGTQLSHDQRQTLEDHECDVTDAVQLCATKSQVRAINMKAFSRLPGQAYRYQCVDHFKWNPKHSHLQYKGKQSVDGSGTLVALEDHLYEATLQLKVGMRVVLLQNLNIQRGLVNGSQGVIVGFKSFEEAALPQARSHYEDSYDLDDRRERIVDDNVPSLGGDHVFLRQEKIKEFIMRVSHGHKYWPEVKFDNGIRTIIQANCSVSSMGDDQPYSLISRTQIPLIAAWAMTIHKAQGTTLEKAIVDVSKIWEEGQLYVALSRVRSLYGLKLKNYSSDYDPGKANKEVTDFLRRTFPNVVSL